MVPKDDKKWIVLFLMVSLLVGAICSLGWSAPFLVDDPIPGATYYKLTGPAWLPTIVAADASGMLKTDVSSAVAGVTYNITVAACKSDGVWEDVCSIAVPFSFTRPLPPVAPVNIKLSR